MEESMSDILLETALIVALLAVNGLLAMSEIAVVTARRARLERQADAGDRRAAAAMRLAEEPTQFLSTVQIGITLVGILAGAFGGATIADQLASRLTTVPVVRPYAEEIALALVVASITYLSLIIGELVPKRIALANPERAATLVAGPMRTLSRVAGPLVRLLAASTDVVVRLVGLHRTGEARVTEEDVRGLIAQARATGGIHAGEEEIANRALRLGDRPVSAIATPRTDLEWIGPHEDPVLIRQVVLKVPYDHLLVCQDTVDDVLGIVLVRDLLPRFIESPSLDLQPLMHQPLFVPETTPVLRLLEMFRQSAATAAVVLDEYGGLQGLVTVSDICEDIMGDLPGTRAPADREPQIVPRAEGGWLVDGGTPVEDLAEALGLKLPDDGDQRGYHTTGGLVLTRLGHLPRAGEVVEAMGYRFEVVDMDGRRIDRVLVRPVSGSDAEPSSS
jgi:putative hemolysin